MVSRTDFKRLRNVADDIDSKVDSLYYRLGKASAFLYADGAVYKCDAEACVVELLTALAKVVDLSMELERACAYESGELDDL